MAKSIYYKSLHLSGAGERKARSLRANGSVAVLNLHRVSSAGSSYWPPLDPAVFESLLKFLRAEFTVCSFDELASVDTEKPLAVLSFDDGYYDYVEYVMPLLEKYGMKANMNIIPECVETGKPIWNVQLYDFLNEASPRLINAIDVPGFSAKLTGETPAAKLDFGLRISRYLKSRPRMERDEIWKSIGPFLAEAGTKSTRMMTAEDIKQAAGMTEIGVHSYSHESMGFESNEYFEQDFEKCRRYFADKLRLPLTTYAFPNGSYRPEQLEFLRSRSVRHILLVDEKFADRNSDTFTRITMYGDSESEIRMKALGF